MGSVVMEGYTWCLRDSKEATPYLMSAENNMDLGVPAARLLSSLRRIKLNLEAYMGQLYSKMVKDKCKYCVKEGGL